MYEAALLKLPPLTSPVVEPAQDPISDAELEMLRCGEPTLNNI